MTGQVQAPPCYTCAAVSGPAPQSAPCPYCGQPHTEDVLLCPTSEKLLPLGGRILDGKFRFLRQLGEGGMGAVWKAENILVKKTVAIKLMHVQFSRNEGVLARFRNEATAAGRIGSKHICDILDLGKSELGPYIVMEMLQGSDLADFIQKRGPVDPGTLALIMRQALVGLQAAHAAGIVHRDLKPENIFLHEPEPGRLVVKLMDFGISKFSEGSEAGKTGLGVLMGTPEYMSPEQTEGAGEVNHLTDIWAMGVIMYWALTGKNPFSGPTLAATLMNVAKGDAPSLNTLTPHLPGELIEVVARCLKRDPAHRWQSAQALHDALAPFENLDAGLFTPMRGGGTVSTSATPPPPGTPPPGGTIAAAGVQSGPAPMPGGGAPTWSNQISSSPQAAPTIGGPSSWTVDEDFGRPESLARGGNGMLIGIAVVIVLAVLGGGWALWAGLSSDDDDVVVADAADAGAADEGAADAGEDEAAETSGPADGDDGEPAAAETAGAEPAGEDAAPGEADDGADDGGDAGDDAGDEAGADAGDDEAADDGEADDDAADDAAADDGGKSSGGTTTSKPDPKPKPKPLRLVASRNVRAGATHAEAKAHCASLRDQGASWSLPTQAQANLLGSQNGWLANGQIWNARDKRPVQALGAARSRAVCVGRVRQ
jgi:eukaryotic-like serine/threonine-protein kinase